MARVEWNWNGRLGGLNWTRWRYWSERDLRWWIRAVLCLAVEEKEPEINHLPHWEFARRSCHEARRESLRARKWTLSVSRRARHVSRRAPAWGKATTNCNWRRCSCLSSFCEPGHGLKGRTWCARSVDKIPGFCARASWRVHWKRCWEVMLSNCREKLRHSW